MPESIPLWLLVAFIAVAVAAGLWLGGRANRELDERRDREGTKTIGERARTAMTRGIVSVWKWNRSRKKRSEEKS